MYISDTNECSKNPCEHICTNTIGFFNCSCNDGYVLDENGRSCNGTYACNYADYPQIFTNVHYCIDIDECLSGPCPSHFICNNMDGNYSCDCPSGTMKNGTDCVCKCLHVVIVINCLGVYTIILAQ